MKRYRLKRDLPTFKDGCEFVLTQFGLVWDKDEYGNNVVRDSPIIAYSAYTLQNFPNILKEWFEEIPEHPKTVDDLKYGDECWIMASNPAHYEEPCAMRQTYRPALKSWLEMGELYLTEEECNRAITKQKAETILQRDTKGFKPNWDNHEQEKWHVDFDHKAKKFWVERCTFMQTEQIDFATQEDAEASIKAHSEEWKIYLGVEG